MQIRLIVGMCQLAALCVPSTGERQREHHITHYANSCLPPIMGLAEPSIGRRVESSGPHRHSHQPSLTANCISPLFLPCSESNKTFKLRNQYDVIVVITIHRNVNLLG